MRKRNVGTVNLHLFEYSLFGASLGIPNLWPFFKLGLGIFQLRIVFAPHINNPFGDSLLLMEILLLTSGLNR